jgi:hypothetical protein
MKVISVASQGSRAIETLVTRKISVYNLKILTRQSVEWEVKLLAGDRRPMSDYSKFGGSTSTRQPVISRPRKMATGLGPRNTICQR